MKILIWKPPEEHDISKSDGIGGREQFPNSPLPLLDPLSDDWQVPREPFMVSDDSEKHAKNSVFT